MKNTVILKCSSIEKCVARAREEYRAAGRNFSRDHSRQDAALLNILRGCEQSLDLGNILAREFRLGIPETSGSVFLLLAERKLIPQPLAKRLVKMAGFRNLALHQYQNLNLKIVARVIRLNLNDLLKFSHLAIKLVAAPPERGGRDRVRNG